MLHDVPRSSTHEEFQHASEPNKCAEERVARVADVVHARAAKLPRQQALDEKSREATQGGGERGGDGSAGHGVCVAMDDQRGAGVESVPGEGRVVLHMWGYSVRLGSTGGGEVAAHQPNQRRKVPMSCRGVEWPSKSLGQSKRPVRGPRIFAPTW